jgi:uncharacterized membrane protein
MNYVGHGSILSWSGESILGTDSLPTLSNTRLPIILSWTCLDGYWLYPRTDWQSLIETILRAPNSGAVAAFSPTGLGIVDGHDALQKGFYDAIFRDGVQHLGGASIEAKLDLYATGNNYDLINTFTMFGDPALRLTTFSIAAAPQNAARSGATGSIVTYTFAISNLSYLSDTVTTYITSTWSVTAPVIPIGPGQAANLVISVTVPLTAAHNSQDHAAITFQSIGDQTAVTATMTTTAIRYEGRLSSPAVTQSGDPGTVVTYPVQLNNLGGVPDTFDLSVLTAKWPTSLSLAQASLSVSQSITLTASVSVSLQALATDHGVAIVQAKSQGNQTTATLRLTTTVNEIDGISLTSHARTLSVHPGSAITHTVRVTNTGNLTSAISITGSGNLWPTTIAPTWIPALPPRAGTDVAVRVQAPFTSTEISDQVKVVAVLQAGAMPSATAYLTSTTIFYSSVVQVQPEAQTADPGSTVTYTVRLTNTGETTDTFDLNLGTHTWPIGLGLTQATLGISQSVSFALSVSIPSNVIGGSSEAVQLDSVSHGNGSIASALFTTTAAVLYGLDLQPALMTQTVKAGHALTYTLRVTNTSNVTSAVSLANGASVWPLTMVPSSIPALPPCIGLDVTVVVQVPLITPVLLDTTSITATLQAGPLPQAVAYLVTQAEVYRLYLPRITKSP